MGFSIDTRLRFLIPAPLARCESPLNRKQRTVLKSNLQLGPHRFDDKARVALWAVTWHLSTADLELLLTTELYDFLGGWL